jgi:hypothetical protein
MRTYGQTSAGTWVTLTQNAITGAINPVSFTINDVNGNVFNIVSTVYNALTTFTSGSATVNSGDVLQNNVITNTFGTILLNIWEDVTQGITLSIAPTASNIYQQSSGTYNFYANWGLSAGQVEIVDSGYIWLATLTQTLRLNTNESPFYSNYGIPAQRSVRTQIAPDLALNTIQNQFAPYFASLAITKQQNATNPTYNVSAVFLNGTVIQNTVAT